MPAAADRCHRLVAARLGRPEGKLAIAAARRSGRLAREARRLDRGGGRARDGQDRRARPVLLPLREVRRVGEPLGGGTTPGPATECGRHLGPRAGAPPALAVGGLGVRLAGLEAGSGAVGLGRQGAAPVGRGKGCGVSTCPLPDAVYI